MTIGRHAAIALAAILSSSPTLAAPPAAPESPPMMRPSGCLTGHIATVRISRIKPGATMLAFDKAAADHAKWYADHGFPNDRVVVVPVLVPNAEKTDLLASSDQVMTMHTHSSHVPAEKHDAAWNAYVDEYHASSDMLSETMVCMPD